MPSEKVTLSVAIPTHTDRDGLLMTLQAIALYHTEVHSLLEVVVVNNTPEDNYNISLDYPFALRYKHVPKQVGTAFAKQTAVSSCSGTHVLAIDSHIMLPKGVLNRLINFYREQPDTPHLYQGPYISNDVNKQIGNCFKPVWSSCMYGQWSTQPHTDGITEILMQGMGLFSFTRKHWPGFHPLVRGFGGEEYFIHTIYRSLGRKCYSLEWLEWWHRAGHVNRVPYMPDVKDIMNNYILCSLIYQTPTLEEIRTHFVPQFASNARFNTVLKRTQETLNDHLQRQKS